MAEFQYECLDEGRNQWVCRIPQAVEGGEARLSEVYFSVPAGATAAEQAACVYGLTVNPPEPPVPTPEERLDSCLARIRAERNKRLAACDWTQLPDVDLDETARTVWADYRQALRDLPETITEPDAAIAWPVEPA